MAISQKLIKIIAFRLCHFEDIDSEIECHPLESDTRGGPPPSPPRSYATGWDMATLKEIDVKNVCHNNHIIHMCMSSCYFLSIVSANIIEI